VARILALRIRLFYRVEVQVQSAKVNAGSKFKVQNSRLEGKSEIRDPKSAFLTFHPWNEPPGPAAAPASINITYDV
jgi:hypothetical protein